MENKIDPTRTPIMLAVKVPKGNQLFPLRYAPACHLIHAPQGQVMHATAYTFNYRSSSVRKINGGIHIA